VRFGGSTPTTVQYAEAQRCWNMELDAKSKLSLRRETFSEVSDGFITDFDFPLQGQVLRLKPKTLR